jgi:hypothetical protein
MKRSGSRGSNPTADTWNDPGSGKRTSASQTPSRRMVAGKRCSTDPGAAMMIPGRALWSRRLPLPRVSRMAKRAAQLSPAVCSLSGVSHSMRR